MKSSQSRTLRYSVSVYRGLIRVYPRVFLDRFGDELEQSFEDLSRRTLNSGGFLRLIALWISTLRDLGVSAVREHLAPTPWVSPSRLVWRWILACMVAFKVAEVADREFAWLGAPLAVRIVLPGIMLGLLQAGWALRQPMREVLLWTAATAAGAFVLALPYRLVLIEVTAEPSFSWDTLASEALAGLGIGLLQAFLLPGAANKLWRWVPANVLGGIMTMLGTMVLLKMTEPAFAGIDLEIFIPPPYRIHWGPFALGLIFGCVTSVPLRSILKVSPTGTPPETKVKEAVG